MTSRLAEQLGLFGSHRYYSLRSAKSENSSYILLMDGPVQVFLMTQMGNPVRIRGLSYARECANDLAESCGRPCSVYVLEQTGRYAPKPTIALEHIGKRVYTSGQVD